MQAGNERLDTHDARAHIDGCSLRLTPRDYVAGLLCPENRARWLRGCIVNLIPDNVHDKVAASPAGLAARAKALCDDPAAFFNHSYTEMQAIPTDDLEALQLAGLKWRFADLRDRIPMLKKLADSQEIAGIDELNAIVPLLFEHTMYKSYPPSLLENGRFVEINKFLSKLCTFDLSTVDVSKCATIDDWMINMDRESPLLIMHSSGSSGTMSFLPTSKKEWDKFGRTLRVTFIQDFGDDPAACYEEDIYAIYPYFRHGGSGHVRQCEIFVKYFCETEDRLFTAYPGRMSSDLLYLGSKIQSSARKGKLHQLKISPNMLARQAEYEKIQREMPERLMAFFAEIVETLGGKRIFYSGAQNLLYNVTKIGQEMGLSHVFAPSSIISTGGDWKGGEARPDSWREQICEFVGIEKTRMVYGMTEIGGLHNKCANDHYHFTPWVIPYVLNPDTSEVLPRRGRTKGRAAFFDLGSETRWGGFITGDEIDIEWDTPCGCGQATVWAHDGITRLSAQRGGDDKISCAATEGAHQDAMDFLNTY